MQAAIFAVLVVAFAGLTLLLFVTASFSAASTGAPLSLSDFERVAEWFISHPLEPKATPRGNIPIPNLLISIAVNIAVWALVASVTWSATFNALFCFFRRGTRLPHNQPMHRTGGNVTL
jgi:hypothetical protein